MTRKDDDELASLGSQVFQPFPEDPQFDEIMATQIDDIVRSRQMHSPQHFVTCFKFDHFRGVI